MTAEQVKIYRSMDPAKKLQIAANFYFSSRELKAASLRSLHPDWPEERVKAKVRDLFLYAAD
jgi:hypothetical protein